jgi:hypothetical protein
LPLVEGAPEPRDLDVDDPLQLGLAARGTYLDKAILQDPNDERGLGQL